MISRSFTVRKASGLHMKFASDIMRIARESRGRVVLQCGGVVSDAHSVLGILILGASRGDRVTVQVDGEEAALLDKI